jgi:branched-chain amino acid aminotransferase
VQLKLPNLYLFFNNKFYPSDTPIFIADNKAFRYGLLVFETMRYSNGQLFFWEAHFNRLEKAAQLLGIVFPKYFTAPILKQHILKLVEKNKLAHARIRVTLCKGGGGLFENEVDAFNVLVETYPLPNPLYSINSNGLDICLYTDMQKTTDAVSNYKTGNHLIYQLAAQYAKNNKCNEALIGNIHNHYCDSTISNLFIVKENVIYTPPLSDGCIDGIMRNYILQKEKNIQEQSLDTAAILNADEVFLTNTVRGIQWVKQLNSKKFTATVCSQLFEKIIAPLNQQ